MSRMDPLVAANLLICNKANFYLNVFLFTNKFVELVWCQLEVSTTLFWKRCTVCAVISTGVIGPYFIEDTNGRIYYLLMHYVKCKWYKHLWILTWVNTHYNRHIFSKMVQPEHASFVKHVLNWYKFFISGIFLGLPVSWIICCRLFVEISEGEGIYKYPL